MSADAKSAAAAREGLEAWLGDSEARLRAIFDLSGAGVVIVRGDDVITYVNQAFARMLGYAPSELVGQRPRRAPSEFNSSLKPGIAALRSGMATAIDIERTYLHRDGRQIAAAVSLHLLPIPADFRAVAGDDEQLSRFVGIAYDITDRKLAEAQLREHQRLLEEAQRLAKIGHWTWNVTSGRAVWSDQIYRVLGLAPGEREPHLYTFEEFVTADDQHVVRKLGTQLGEGADSATVEFQIRRTDGELRDVVGRAVAERTENNALVGIVGTMQDITDRKRQEAILREAKANAEAANRAKTNFLAAMSHELRTPLNAILGFAQLLALRTQGPLTTAQSSYVANIIQGGEHLLHLINDVLDLARIDTGKLTLNLDHVEIEPLLQSVVEDFQSMAKARAVNLRFIAGFPLTAKADRMRLTQVLVNLVSNAIKYNRPEGNVALRGQKPHAGRIRIVVEDTGRGIPIDRHDEVFESFNRLGAEATGEEGTGIGLSLSKRLAEEMGGTIGFESTPGAGSIFWVDLPDAVDSDIVSVAGLQELAG